MTDSQPPDRVAENYKDKTLLVTGGTGFMGKVLIEKILRTSHEVKRIYILVRTKKGKSPQARVKEIFSSALFEKVRKMRGDEIIDKIVPIPGDVMEPNLGLSAEDRKTLAEEVHIIYHMAASIRFDDPLRKAVLMNVRGTKYMVDLAKECKVLMVFVHVSTAYCYLGERVLYEKVYPPPSDPHMLIKCAEWMDEATLETITPKILGQYPNTYAFTKALGENLVVNEMDTLPVIVLRPSVVVPVWLEPVPGWTDNINGPAGLLIGAGKGVLRTMYIDSKNYADFLPVDIAVNVLMLSTMDYVVYKTRRIYNVTSSFEYKVNWEEIIEIGRELINTKMPLNGVVWYPGGSMKRSLWLHNVCAVLFHWIPAIFLDMLIFLSGNKPVLWRVHQRISKGFDVYEYYANRQWDFNNDGSLKARRLMNETEKKLYKVDGHGMDIREYLLHCIHCTRLYILKEGDETLPAAKRHMAVMWLVDRIVKALLLVGLIYLLLKHIVYPIFGWSW